MIKVLLILFHLFLFSTGYSQIIPVRNINGIAYDYIDTITKKTISKYAYDQASPFVEGMARVNRNGLFGFINTKGEEIISCKYIHANDFSEGLVSVSIGTQEITENTIWVKDEKYGVIDKIGQKVIAFEFKDIARFKNGIARACDLTTRKWGWIDNKGNWDISPKFENSDDFNALEMAKVGVDYESNGYINRQGDFIINPIFYQIGDFIDGIAYAKKWGQKEKYDGKYGFINSEGETIVPFIYDNVQEFSENLALVGKRNDKGEIKFGFIDKKGVEQVTLKFEYAHSFSSGMAFVKQKSKYGWIDNKGKYLITNLYDVAEDFRFPEEEGIKRIVLNAAKNKYNTAIVSKNGFWGVIDFAGKEILPIKYDSVRKTSEGIIAKKDNTILLFDNETMTPKIIDQNSKSITDNNDVNFRNQLYYSDILSLNTFKKSLKRKVIIGQNDSLVFDFSSNNLKFIVKSDLIKVQDRNKGINSILLIDSIKYASARFNDDKRDTLDKLRFDENLVIYSKEKVFLILKGYYYNEEDVILPTDYDDIENLNEYSFSTYGLNLFRVKKGNKYGVVKVQNKKIFEIVKPTFDDIGILPNCSYNQIGFLIPVNSEGLWGVLNSENDKLLLKCKYKDIGGFNQRDRNLLCQVKKDNKWAIYDVKGKKVTSFLYEDMLTYSEGLCPVKKMGKWGFLNKYGFLVVPAIFEIVTTIDGSEWVGKLNKMDIVIDSYGNALY